MKNLFGERPLADTIEEAMLPARKYNQKEKRKQFKPKHSRFKLKFYYIDGNQSIHYSYDFYYKYTDGVKETVNDEFKGLKTLLRCIKGRRNTFVTAMIWLTLVKNKKTKMDENDGVIERYDIPVVKYVRNRNVLRNPTVEWANNQLILDLVMDCPLVVI